jgi:hypothetical protein
MVGLGPLQQSTSSTFFQFQPLHNCCVVFPVSSLTFCLCLHLRLECAQFGDAVYSSIPFALNEEFSPVLRRQLDYFNHDPSSDRITAVKSELNDVKGTMVQNIEKVRKHYRNMKAADCEPVLSQLLYLLATHSVLEGGLVPLVKLSNMLYFPNYDVSAVE